MKRIETKTTENMLSDFRYSEKLQERARICVKFKKT
jgi:hypothetical protein